MADQRRGVFVTGTDTSVGKTVVAAGILSVLRGAGIDAVPMKPVQTGCEDTSEGLIAPDLEFCLAMNGMSVSATERESMCPYRFRDACSPHLAARRDDSAIEMDRILESFDVLASKHEFVVVEGAGGVLVPLDDMNTMLNLMVSMALPVILVSRSGLGTISHTLLSLDVLKRSGLEVAGVVLDDTEAVVRGYIEKDNERTIEQMGGVPVLGWLPAIPYLDPASFPGECAQHLPSDRILKQLNIS